MRKRSRFKRLLIGVVVAGVLVVAGFLALAWKPAIAPIDPPAAASFPADLVARGAVLAGAGNCASCHTVKGGADFAGGLALATGFGTIYSSNITPDPETGIGRWSEAAFARALHDGVARDGSHLFPAFPFDHFTKVTDEDLTALYAYLMTQKPVQAAQKPSTLPFPLNIRLLQAGWKLLFLHGGVYQPDPTKTAEWNRGAYLAEGLGHCGACHTPRNALGAERSGDAYGGATIDGWIAPALTAANPSPASWTEDELFAYLRSGASILHGTAAGSMSEVVHDGLAKLPDPDIRAIAAYFAEIDQAGTRAADTETAIAKAAAASAQNTAQLSNPDAHLYITACASCHYSGAAMPLAVRPDLSLNSALSLDEPTNFVKVVLSGISLKDGMPGVMMPGFAHSFSDAEIARLAAYLRATRTELPAWTDLETKVAAIRQETPAP